MVQFRINSGMGLSRFKGFGALEMVYPAFWSGNLDCRQISQLVKSNKKRLFLVDTLALVRKLERQGVPLNQPEAITAAITQIEMIQESSLSKFKSQVQSSQGNYFSLLQHETVKLHNDIEKMRSELRLGMLYWNSIQGLRSEAFLSPHRELAISPGQYIPLSNAQGF
ncbi:hypothetical protein UlMin_030216 [Ulmus minor]